MLSWVRFFVVTREKKLRENGVKKAAAFGRSGVVLNHRGHEGHEVMGGKNNHGFGENV